MGNCATNCTNCMGKDGEIAEFNMDNQTSKLGIVADNNISGAQGLMMDGNQTATGGSRDYNRLLQSKMRYIVKLQAFWRGHTARRLISMLRAK